MDEVACWWLGGRHPCSAPMAWWACLVDLTVDALVVPCGMMSFLGRLDGRRPRRSGAFSIRYQWDCGLVVRPPRVPCGTGMDWWDLTIDVLASWMCHLPYQLKIWFSLSCLVFCKINSDLCDYFAVDFVTSGHPLKLHVLLYFDMYHNYIQQLSMMSSSWKSIPAVCVRPRCTCAVWMRVSSRCSNLVSCYKFGSHKTF